ncbi:MAG TPA: radical SAM protein, partial [Phycisphaerae bacterium]|nr:radical SAM protein [Phycisphaerae bacterium]
MKILLVYPLFPKSFWSFAYALEIHGRKALLPPLGLITVAAMLPAAWEKRLVDMNVQTLTDEDLEWADYVFLSGMTVQRESAHEVAARAKAAGKVVVAGGPLFSGEYSLFPEVPHFVLSEGELTIGKLVADMEAGKLKRIYRSREYADMTTSPVPLWNLVDVNKYACMAVQYTRGCPYDCEFCNVTALLGRAPRTKKATQIVAELDAIKATGWRGDVFFVDDNLIGNRPALKKDLLPALIEWQKKSGPMPFTTQASINLADDAKLTEQMTEAGFDTVFVGIETSDPEALKECNKKQNRNRSLVDDVHKLQAAGIEVQAGFIVGFDHDTEASFKQQADFIQASGIVTAMVGMLNAPPGTRLVQRMWQEGRLHGQSTGNNTDGTTNIIPKMGLENLRNGYLRLLNDIYSPKPAYTR